MNQFDERYVIRMAEYADIDSIMNFIRCNWNAEHILGNNRQFFEYEHVEGQQVNFVIAIARNTQQIEGIYGFLKASHEEEYMDVWGVMWMVREGGGNVPFLGIELIKRLKTLIHCRSILGIGSDPKTAIPILKLMLKYHTGKMEQYYRLNSECQEFRVAVINEKKTVQRVETAETYLLKRYGQMESLREDFTFADWKECIPYKDEWYMNHRFFQHPIYKYEIYGVCNGNGKVQAVLVCRRLKQNGAEILRIVDYVGDHKAMRGLYDALGELLSSGVEYIDFYCYGFEEALLSQAGFVKREDEDCNIIPNYFEPFVQKNIDIFVDWPLSEPCFCKADGDQDRPSRV